MKITITNAITTALLGLTIASTSCKKEQATSSAPANPGEEIKITLYCSGAKYQNSKEFFRGSATGNSLSMETAKKKAMSNTRNYIASNINTTVKAVTDNYTNSRTFNNREEVEERFEFLSREVVNQELQGLEVICEEVTQNSADRKYTYYIAMQLSGADLLEKVNERISNDERLKIDYDYEKFKETFNKEMEEMSKR